ncbi:MAG: DinB family protein [Chitinophagaceae bacterium]|nr:DinB family protein [Chitinophagaceae bacterium]
MNPHIKALRSGRKLVQNIVDSYSLDQLNKIPEGFKNNLIWNVGHVIVAQQSIVYRGSGLPLYVSDALFDQFKPGSKPERDLTQEEVDHLRILLHSLPDQLEADLEKGLFTQYTERTTVTGFHLASLEDALIFNNYHEGMHMGYMLAMRKLV